MTTYTVGYIVGSLSAESINRMLSKAMVRLAPDDLSFVEIPIKDLPLYNQDLDADYPPPAGCSRRRYRLSMPCWS
jgi:chromate reductase, NAD(P)H dehydrogenase (quinone)